MVIVSEIEKITTNVSVVDLGQIDLLVQQGFYSNRTDFLRTAIRNQLSSHAVELKQTVIKKKMALGIMSYNRKELEAVLQSGELLDIKVVGMLVFDNDVPTRLIEQTIRSVEVHGVIRASKEVKEAVHRLMDNAFYHRFK